MTPSTFNHVQELLRDMRDQDLILERNPLNRQAAADWKTAYRELIKLVDEEETVEINPPFWLSK